MSPDLYAKFMNGLFGFVAGASFAMIIGFVWGGWTTATPTQKLNDDAGLASPAAICLRQIKNPPNHDPEADRRCGAGQPRSHLRRPIQKRRKLQGEDQGIPGNGVLPARRDD